MATSARVAAATALVIAVVLLAVAGRTDVVVIPAPVGDRPEAVLLDDGTPAWTYARDGQVVLLSALTPSDGVIGGVVGWCTDGGRFVDPHLGLSFAVGGDRFVGGVPGRLPPDAAVGGLSHFEVEVIERSGHRDLVRVHASSPGALATKRPTLSGQRTQGPPMSCRLPDRRLGGGNPSSVDSVADHAHLAQSLDRRRDGWQIAEGWLQVGPGAETRWCRGAIDRDARCDPVPSDLDLRHSAATPSVVTGVGDPLAVRIADGTITDVAALPSSTWVGSSLRGARSLRVRYLGRDVSGSRLIVAGGASDPCIGPAPTMSQAPDGSQVVYLDLDTVIELAWADSPTALPPVGEAPAGPVEVVLDAVTCRALLLTESP